MIVDFYLLSPSRLERALPSICEKVIATGERLLIVAEQSMLESIDRLLWTYSNESFLPHGADHGERQPVQLSSEPVAQNGASSIALADGRWRDEALGFSRAFYFFDSAHLDEARAAWRSLTARDGVEARYWKQAESGKWVQGP